MDKEDDEREVVVKDGNVVNDEDFPPLPSDLVSGSASAPKDCDNEVYVDGDKFCLRFLMRIEGFKGLTLKVG